MHVAYDGRTVLDRLNLSIDAGTVFALAGRSGAGKTTILRLVNRLLLPQAGRVIVDGRDTSAWNPIRLRRRIGYVMQEGGLLPHLTVEANVALVPTLERWEPSRIRARTRELLALVGLPPQEFSGRWPRELSGGQRQRVGIARALAADPSLLLLDEPFGALDPVTRAEVRREFERIQQQVGKTVLLVTHDLAEAFALAQRVGVLVDGRLAACGVPAEVACATDPRVREFLDALPPPLARAGMSPCASSNSGSITGPSSPS